MPEPSRNVLSGLGLFGMERIEPVVLASLITGDPLLLIGPHGTGKSYLLNRIAQALSMESRHYNASLLNYDDLVGYPRHAGSGASVQAWCRKHGQRASAFYWWRAEPARRGS